MQAYHLISRLGPVRIVRRPHGNPFFPLWGILFLLLPLGMAAQSPDWQSLDDELRHLRHRADSLWYFGTDPAPIIAGIERVQEQACEAGYDDLWVLGFCDLAEVYETTEDDERYLSNVEMGWRNAQALLSPDDPVRAVAAVGMGGYWWNEVPELEDSALVLLQAALPILEQSKYPKALFWCQLTLAEYPLYGYGIPQEALPWIEAAEASAAQTLMGKSEGQYYLKYQQIMYFYHAGQTSRAIEKQRALIALIENKSILRRVDSASLAIDLNNLANFYEKNGELTKAIQLLEKTIQLKQGLSGLSRADSVSITVSMNNLAGYYKTNGELTKAIQLMEECIQMKQGFSQLSRVDSAELAKDLNNLAVFYETDGELAEAIQVIEECIQMKQELSQLSRADSASIAISMNNLAAIYESNGEFTKAIQVLEESIQVTQRLSSLSRADSAELVSHINNLASAYEANGELTKAIQVIKECLQLNQGLSMLSHADSAKWAIQLGNMAYYYGSLGDFQRSIDFRHQGLAILESLRGIQVSAFGHAIYNFAASYHEQEDYLSAYALIQDAIPKLQHPVNRASANQYQLALLFIGSLPTQMVNQDQVSQYLGEAERIAIRWNINLGEVRYWQGSYAKKQGQYPEAVQYYQQSFDLIKSSFPFGTYERRRLYEAIGDVYLTSSDLDSAVFHHHRALLNCVNDTSLHYYPFNPRLEQLQPGQYLVETISKKALAQYALAQERRSDSLFREAHATYQLGEAAAQRQRSSFSGKLSRLNVSRDAQPLYSGAIRTALALHTATDSAQYLTDAFSAAEQAKGQTMLQAQWEAEATGQGYLPPHLHEERRNHLVNLQFVEEKINSAQSQGDTLEATRLQNRAFEIQQDLENWETRVKDLYPEYHARLTQNFEVAPTAVQQDLLEDGEALIEFTIGKAEGFGNNYIGEDELYTFVLTPDAFQVLRAPLPPNLDSTIAVFVRSISDYGYIHDSTAISYDSYTQTADQLYQWLIAPALAQIPSSTEKLILVPDGSLNQIPFEALLTERADPERIDYGSLPYLIRQVQIQYGYSAAQLLEVEDRAPYANTNGVLAMAPSGPGSASFATRGNIASFRGPHARKLPGTYDEVKALVDAGYEGQYLFGAEATEAAFKDLAEQYTVLYLAQHGFADPEDPVMSYLKFAPAPDSSEDGALHAYELEPLRLKAELAVLSACETGIGQYLPGEGIASLGRQFIAAGVATVVMTLWQVEDRASADLMERFFAHLEEGEEGATALHLAKLDFLAQSDSRTAHPYYWAAYVANGASREVTVGSPWLARSGWGLGLIGSFALLGFAWWVRRMNRVA